MTLIDADLKAFLESDVVVLVGTRDAQLCGEVAFGWGPRVLDGGELEIFVDKAPGARTLENLEENHLLAVTCTSPITYQSFQLKGYCLQITPPEPQDGDWVENHREAFTASALARGFPTHASRTLWTRDYVKLRMMPHERFDQTPGPNAGRKQ